MEKTTGRRRLRADVVKKVRMDKQQAARLKRLARASGMSESDILREGLELMETVRARQANVGCLIALAEGPEPEKVRFELE